MTQISPIEPGTYGQAIASPQADLWKVAMKDEYDSLIRHGTWELVDLIKEQTGAKRMAWDQSR